MISIQNRQQISVLFGQLTQDSMPLFGQMTAQHMVEHLTFSVDLSNGSKPQELQYPQEKAEKIKHFLIYTPGQIPEGFKSPLLPTDQLIPLNSPDLPHAISDLEVALDQFFQFFAHHPEAKPINPTMGELNFQEWICFHNKHFFHHLRQFGLVEKEI